jgi:hypothetical protein
MSDTKRFEEWLKRAADTPEMQDLVAKSDAEPAIPEDVLAEYYAGTLSSEEEQIVRHRTALSERSSAFLTQLDADVQAAAAEVSPRLPALARLRRRVEVMARRASDAFETLGRPAVAWRLAAGAAVLVLAVFAGGRMLDRPPSQFGLPFDPNTSTRGQGTFELPDGAVLRQVDPDWSLREPQRHADRVRWFAWDPVQGASSYQLQLLDSSGRRLYERRPVADRARRDPRRSRGHRD